MCWQGGDPRPAGRPRAFSALVVGSSFPFRGAGFARESAERGSETAGCDERDRAKREPLSGGQAFGSRAKTEPGEDTGRQRSASVAGCASKCVKPSRSRTQGAVLGGAKRKSEDADMRSVRQVVRGVLGSPTPTSDGSAICPTEDVAPRRFAAASRGLGRRRGSRSPGTPALPVMRRATLVPRQEGEQGEGEPA
jgi:hypothetical protein